MSKGPEPRAKRVFVSYSHDSAEHAKRVLALADRLRRDGVDAWLDQYDPEPAIGWPRWMVGEIERADRVLVVCTETYRRRFEGKETDGGLGADWEGAILTDKLYERHRRFVVPVAFSRADLEHRPTVLRQQQTRFVLDGEAGYTALFRLLTDQPATPASPVAPLRRLEPEPRRSGFGFLARPLSSPEPEDGEEVATYRRWAAKRHGRLELIGLGAGDLQVGLEEIYVPLRILEAPEEGRELEARRPREEALSGLQRSVELDRLFLRPDGEGSPRHALVLGEAGSGKTTALRKLHQLALSGGGPEGLGLAPGTLPVFLRLRRLSAESLEKGLDAFLESELQELSGSTLPAGLGELLWRRRRLLLLFDGLDEIADEAHRAAVLGRLRWWLDDPQLGDVRAVISCRYAGWSSERVREAGGERRDRRGTRRRRRGGLLRLDVRPFDDAQIERLVELWFREVEQRGYLDGALADERSAALLRALTDPEQRRQEFLTLVSTPLLLTLLCVVVMRGGEMPRRRVDFYEECLRILLREWRAKQAGRRAPISVDRALAVLGDLAWALHSQHRRDDLTFAQARQLLRRRLGDDHTIAAAFRWLYEDVAILERYTTRHYGFVHLGFQEHLTARHLADDAARPATEDEASPPGALLDQVCAEAGDSWWAEVIQLLAGLPGGRGFAPLMERLLATEVPLRRADLLAACLREADAPDLAPFLEVLEGDAQPEKKAALLRLLRGWKEARLVRLAETLADEPDPVGAAARQLLAAADAEAPAGADVFLLHAPGDHAPAERLAALLAGRSLAVDRPGPDEPWDDPRVLERLADCPTVLVLLGSERPEPEEVVAFLEPREPKVVALPGDPRPEVPEPLAAFAKFDLPSFDDEAALAPLVAAALPAAAAEAPAPTSRAAPAIALGEPFAEPLTGERFLPVPAGRFRMGGTAFSDEQPVHQVRLSAFWLARTPVTNRQYRLFLEATGHDEPGRWRDRRFADPEQPVVAVSWHDAVAYCRWLAESSPARLGFELPTEAQWEYAARGTDGREHPWGDEPPDERRGCFGQDYQSGRPALVGSHPDGAGAFGHLDLAGNVWEWCRDRWEKDYSRWAEGEAVDPIGEADEGLRPLRGGAWHSVAWDLRSAGRVRFMPDFRVDFIGFRVSCASSSTGP